MAQQEPDPISTVPQKSPPLVVLVSSQTQILSHLAGLFYL